MMTHSTQDHWAQWLLHRRFGGIDSVGKQGKVMFSDISQDLLDHCRTLAQQMDVLDRCQFLHASAEDLGAVASQSVDVVTTRSVLIYFEKKPQAFQHFSRALRPNGRLSIFEPINRFAYPEPPHRFFGYEVSPVMNLTQKVVAAYGQPDCDPMMDFDERDLFTFAEQAGFSEVHLELQTTVMPGTREEEVEDEPHRWETFLKSSPNPLVPTFEEAMQRALTSDEGEQLTAYLRPLVEKKQGEERSSVAYLWAVKHELHLSSAG